MNTRIVLFTFLMAMFCSQFSFGQSKVTVAMTANLEFSPDPVTITEGDTIEWVNQSTVQHTSTSGTGCTGDGTWNSGILNQGETFEFVFSSAGSFPYFCIPHCSGGMTGTVTVNPQITGISTEPAIGTDLITLKGVSPNPVGYITMIGYELNRPADVIIRLMNLSGKELFVMNEAQLKGSQQVPLPTATLPTGIYFMQIMVNNKIAAVQKLVKL